MVSMARIERVQPLQSGANVALFLAQLGAMALGCLAASCSGAIDAIPGLHGDAVQPKPSDRPGETSGTGDSQAGSDCRSGREFFAQNVWPTLNERCIACHAPDGVASTGENAKMKTAGFVLQRQTYPNFMSENMQQLQRMVVEQIGDTPKLLTMPIGGANHGGGAVLSPASPEYAAFEQFARSSPAATTGCQQSSGTAMLANISVSDWSETFRRVALVLGGRLPTRAEKNIADEASFDGHVDGLLKEATFPKRVRMYYNDKLLLDGANVDCFTFPAHDYPHATQCTTGDVTYLGFMRSSLREEPLRLIEHVVAQGAPFREILTADYTVVNDYSAVPYGVGSAPTVTSNGVAAPSGTAMDYENWRAVKVKTSSGPYPHAGVLSSPSFLARWPSTPTNQNRARSRLVFASFLATDILTLAQRPIDSSALVGTANAPRNSPACTSCHGALDPVANSFSSYPDTYAAGLNFNMTAATNQHQEMFPPGFGSTLMPGSENRMLPWLAEQVVADPRFAVSVVRNLFEGIIGVPPLAYPSRTADREADAEAFTVWTAQDSFIQDVAGEFASSGFDVRLVAKAIVKSPFFRASGVTSDAPAALSQTLLLGSALPPEVTADHIRAVYGTHWGDWTNKGQPNHLLLTTYKVLFGGIDSTNVVARTHSWTPLSAAVVSRFANDMACKATAWDLGQPSAERALLPYVEVTTIPGAGDDAIRKNLAYLLDRFWGLDASRNQAELEAAFVLFSTVFSTLNNASAPAPLPYACQARWDRSLAAPNATTDAPLKQLGSSLNDPQLTIRTWMAVLTYLASDARFLQF
ncbi:MAG: hypothetical protein JWN04_505 [Myxococcaceae bacterium]|nr:hypothetical protein [Myxococcaceae bacterium]